MTTKRLYALTDDVVRYIEQGLQARASGLRANGDVERAAFVRSITDVLTPVTVDKLDEDTIERMARVFADLEPGEPWPTNEELGGGPTGTRDDEYRHEYLDHARAVLNALLGAPRKDQS